MSGLSGGSAPTACTDHTSFTLSLLEFQKDAVLFDCAMAAALAAAKAASSLAVGFGPPSHVSMLCLPQKDCSAPTLHQCPSSVTACTYCTKRGSTAWTARPWLSSGRTRPAASIALTPMPMGWCRNIRYVTCDGVYTVDHPEPPQGYRYLLKAVHTQGK